jgi:hypothetical protein
MQDSLGGPAARGLNREASLKPRAPEQTIAEWALEVERKSFSICIKENHQGRFCRIIEDSGARRNTIIIPTSGLAEFAELITRSAAAARAAE